MRSRIFSTVAQQVICRRVTLAFSLAVSLTFGSVPLLSAQMKLLSQDTGWLVNVDRLLWTTDDGAHWKDITPSGPTIPKDSKLGSVFFLDTSEGWATLSYPEPIAEPTPQALANQKTLYTIAHTENAGETWDERPLTYPPLPEAAQDTFGGPASLYFLDSIHGWLDVTFQSMFDPGRLLATNDGGQTWNWVSSPIHSGSIFFHSLEDGWIISNYGARELYVTHDGAKSWQESRLMPPAEIGTSIYPMFMEIPMFKDSRDGYLAVHYSGPEFSSPKLVVYATESGGKSWDPIKVLPGSGSTPVALADSVVILPSGAGKGKPSTESVPLTTPAQPSQPVSSESRDAILSFSFLNGSRGWAFKIDGLYGTDDGGATWMKISPPPPMPPGRQIIIRPQSATGAMRP